VAKHGPHPRQFSTNCCTRSPCFTLAGGGHTNEKKSAPYAQQWNVCPNISEQCGHGYLVFQAPFKSPLPMMCLRAMQICSTTVSSIR
jgi:hypothetical protein